MSGFAVKNTSNQLRWVILLLLTVVILPTVCLLWFMNQAVKNQSATVTNTLQRFYQEQNAVLIGKHLNDKMLLERLEGHPLETKLFFDRDSVLRYPVQEESEDKGESPFSSAQQLEFADGKLEDALNAYAAAKKDSTEVQKQFADLSIARCLVKLERKDEAREILQLLASNYKADVAQRAHAFLFLLDLKEQDDPGRELLKSILYFAMLELYVSAELENAEYLETALPTALHILLFQRYIASADLAVTSGSDIAQATNMISTLELSLELANRPEFIEQVHQAISKQWFIFPLAESDKLLCIQLPVEGGQLLQVFHEQVIYDIFDDYIMAIEALPAGCRGIGPDGSVIFENGSEDRQEPFLTTSISEGLMSGCQIDLFIDDSTFTAAEERGRAVYIWAAVLVISLILLCGGVAGKELLRQQQMNRLKNYFIATVTHELKTPLASMRALVDTLLEGSYENESTVREYHELISKENLRLSHLIDSFLTFSRMERNKQVFEFTSVTPEAIALAGYDAARTRLHGHDCAFNLDISPDLPIIEADKEGMVTVLVNLLENACKYAGENQEITMSVYASESDVCFAVSDNGLGIPKRLQKKVFERFYQANSRLSRGVEGCGLGLSIVKYIVNAHHGTIELESQPDAGCTFTVRIPRV